MRSLKKFALVAAIAPAALCDIAHADHVLLDDGRLLFNVMVPQGTTTGTVGRLTRIRTTRFSFELDPRTNVVTPLPPYTIVKRVADFVNTTETIGRQEAASLQASHRWNQYIPPAPEVLVAPTPAPKATPLPVIAAAGQPTPVPLNVVSPTLPLEQRLDRQMDLFTKEQTKLSQDAVTSVVRGILSPEQIRQAKVNLLQRQKGILEQYYPQTTETVKLAINYWTQQIERTSLTGKFDVENL